MKILLSLLIGTILTACTSNVHNSAENGDEYTLLAKEDKEHGVICYHFKYFEGMSCIKIDEAKSCNTFGK